MLAPVPSLSDWYVTGPHRAVVLERRMPGPARMSRAELPSGERPDPPSPDLSPHLVLRGTPLRRLDFGAGRFEVRAAPGMFVVSPPETVNAYLSDGAHLGLATCLRWAEFGPAIAAVSGGRLSDLGPLHRGAWHDPRARQVLHALWQADQGAGPGSLLYAESLVQSLAEALVALALPGRRRQEPTRLTAWRLRRAQAMLADRLDEKLALAEVANAVGLSPWHFARGFKAVTGVAPHTWRNARRIAEAQRLLADPARGVAEIAFACGFCSQAHLTNAFRRATGSTPAAWRREAGPVRH